MSDERASLEVLCKQIAFEHLDKSCKFKVLKSRPYIKKQNRTGDIAQWQCWHTHLRISKTPKPDDKVPEQAERANDWKEFDLFVTVIRHKYIPPLMEHFTDLAVISKKDI
jgi:hypothetical protein